MFANYNLHVVPRLEILSRNYHDFFEDEQIPKLSARLNEKVFKRSIVADMVQNVNILV